MRILTALVSYNRLPLLVQTVESYLATVTGPHRLLIVDNASDAPTRRWLERCGVETLYLDENRYPGFATNTGWEQLLADRRLGANVLLHRSDNDVEYLSGWCKEVRRVFADPTVGQVGLRTLEEEGAHGNVGGNNVIRRQVWDQGVRYDSQPWSGCAFEDGRFTNAVGGAGWQWTRVVEPCVVHTGTNYAEDPGYYAHTFGIRGLGDPPA